MSLVKRTIYYTIGNFSGKAINFLLLPLYTAYLNPNEFGIVSSMQVFMGLLLIFLTLGLERSIYRLFFDYKSEEGKRLFLGTISIGIFFFSLMTCALLFLFKDLVTKIYSSINFYPYFAYVILTAFFMTYEMIPKTNFQVKEKAREYLGLSLALLVLRVVPVIIFVVLLKQEAQGMLKGAMIGNGISLFILVPITLKNIALRFDIKIFKKTLYYCLPLIPVVLATWVVNMSDRIFLEQFFSTYEVGIYSFGYKIGESVQFLGVSVLMAYSPFFFKIANTATNAGEKLFKLNRIITIFFIGIVFVGSLLSKEIVFYLFDAEYHTAYYIVPLIFLGYLFVQFNSLQTKAFHQKKKTVQLMYINIVGALVNIGLNFILIQKYSYLGAALSTLSTQLLLFILTYHLAKKYYFIPFDWKTIIPILVSCTIIVTVDQVFFGPSPVSLGIKLGVVFILTALVYLKKDNIKEEFKIIENNE